MVLAESQLKEIILETILQEQEADKIEDILDQAFDTIENDVEDTEDDLIDSFKELKAKETNEARRYNMQSRLDEAGLGMLAISTAAAFPVIMKGIGLASKGMLTVLEKAGKAIGKDYDFTDKKERWESWWNKKSESLHHTYIHMVEKGIDGFCWATGKEISKEKKHKLAEGIWTGIVAFLMYKSGVGLLKAVGNHTYGVAGLEAVLTSIKGGEIGVYVKGLFETAGLLA